MGRLEDRCEGRVEGDFLMPARPVRVVFPAGRSLFRLSPRVDCPFAILPSFLALAFLAPTFLVPGLADVGLSVRALVEEVLLPGVPPAFTPWRLLAAPGFAGGCPRRFFGLP